MCNPGKPLQKKYWRNGSFQEVPSLLSTPERLNET
jgi:hypothetical protein